MTAPPLPVSIVMPCFNAANVVAAALASLAGQTVPPAEVLVIDDASSDDTIAHVERFRDLLPIRVLRQSVNAGPGMARRRALDEATQPWIAALDADDVALPDHLETLWRTANGDEGVIAAPGMLVWEPGRSLVDVPIPVLPAEPVAALTAIGRRNTVPVASMFSTDAARSAGSYAERRKAEDMALWLRMVARGCRVVVADHPTFVYRRSASSNSTDVAAVTFDAVEALGDAIAHITATGIDDPELIRALVAAQRRQSVILHWQRIQYDGVPLRLRPALGAVRHAPLLSAKAAVRLAQARRRDAAS